MTGAVLIRDQFGNGVGDIMIDIKRADGGEVIAQRSVLCILSMMVF